MVTPKGMILEYSLSLVLIRNVYMRLIRILSKEKIGQADIEDINMLCGMLEQAAEDIRGGINKEIMSDRVDKNFEKYL